MENKFKIIVTATPLRISFTGGGTDIKNYYKIKDGNILSTTIDKYLYVTVKRHNDLFKEKFRLNYSFTETKQKISDIQNNITRECLKYLKINFPLYISTVSDIPAETGLGSSSAFTVGLLNALYILIGKRVSLHQLAEDACKIEITKLKKSQGKQDQYAAVFGGINKFTFKKNEKVIVRKIKLKTKVLNSLNNNLFLVWSKKQRKADSILQSQNKNFRYNLANLNKINHQTKKLINIFQNDYNLSSFSKIINENWENKIKLSKKIFNKQLKILSHKIMLSGATGLKILGAGGGGFFLVIVPNKNKNFFLHQMSKYKIVNFKLESNGTQVILKR